MRLVCVSVRTCVHTNERSLRLERIKRMQRLDVV